MSCTFRLRANPRAASALLALALFAAAAPSLAQQSQSHTPRARLFSSDRVDMAGRPTLSPDGKWLAFSVMKSPSTATIAVVPVGGSTPQLLPSQGAWDNNPQWSPTGDRIYFVSNRSAQPGDRYYYGFAVGFDRRSGRFIGEPRQITTDAVFAFVRVSPDGQTLAYIDARDRRQLKVVPTAGGMARIVAQIPIRSAAIAWSRDGRQLYFTTNVPERSKLHLSRVSLSGGEPVVVSTNLPIQSPFVVGPGAERFVVGENGDGPRDRILKLVDRGGSVLTTIATNRNTYAAQIAQDGRSIIAVESNVVAPTRIMPVDGGAFREITPPATYDWVMTWSPDGSMVYTWTESAGASVLAAVPLSGGVPRNFPETKEWGAAGANSQYLFQATRREGAKPRALAAIDLRTGARHSITDSLPGVNLVFPYGPGGTWAVHDELYYLERHGDQLAVTAWRGPGDVRTLRMLPWTLAGRTSIAVHGQRVAWQQERSDSADIMIADDANAKPRLLLTMPLPPGSNELAFSPDGRTLALHYSRGRGSPDLLVFVAASGAVPPRVVDTGLSYWYWPRWMPDNSGVLVIGGGAGAEAHVWRIPAGEGARPVNVTAGDPSSKWGFEVSPDGRFIAYPGEILRGSTVWRFELGGGAR